MGGKRQKNTHKKEEGEQATSKNGHGALRDRPEKSPWFPYKPSRGGGILERVEARGARAAPSPAPRPAPGDVRRGPVLLSFQKPE